MHPDDKPAKPFEEMTRDELLAAAKFWLGEYEGVVRDHSAWLDRQRKTRELIAGMTGADWLAAAEYYVREKL